MEKQFNLGRLTLTKGVFEHMDESKPFAQFVQDSILRYIASDWGDLCEEDKRQNDYAVQNSERILAAYIFSDTGEKIWIITEWDRSVTTILFPDEY